MIGLIEAATARPARGGTKHVQQLATGDRLVLLLVSAGTKWAQSTAGMLLNKMQLRK